MAKKKETVIKPKKLGEQEASKEKINRAFKTDERLNAIADSGSYKTYMKEYKNYHGWQNAEPMDTEPDVRYEFDKENYLKEFHGKHLAPIEDYREIDLLGILIDSVKTALHPSHVEYRVFLQAKIDLYVDITKGKLINLGFKRYYKDNVWRIFIGRTISDKKMYLTVVDFETSYTFYINSSEQFRGLKKMERLNLLLDLLKGGRLNYK